MIVEKNICGDFEITSMRLPDGHVLHFTVSDPAPESHKHENSMIAYGGMSIETGQYSKTVSTGESTKFTPRAGLSAFEPGLTSTLTAIGLTKYVCVKGKIGTTLNYEQKTFPVTTVLDVGVLVVLIDDCLINGKQKMAGDLIFAAQGETLKVPAGTRIGVFTPQ